MLSLFHNSSTQFYASPVKSFLCLKGEEVITWLILIDIEAIREASVGAEYLQRLLIVELWRAKFPADPEIEQFASILRAPLNLCSTVDTITLVSTKLKNIDWPLEMIA